MYETVIFTKSALLWCAFVKQSSNRQYSITVKEYKLNQKQIHKYKGQPGGGQREGGLGGWENGVNG